MAEIEPVRMKIFPHFPGKVRAAVNMAPVHPSRNEEEEETLPIRDYEQLLSWERPNGDDETTHRPNVPKRAERSRAVSGKDWTSKSRRFEGDFFLSLSSLNFFNQQNLRILYPGFFFFRFSALR